MADRMAVENATSVDRLATLLRIAHLLMVSILAAASDQVVAGAKADHQEVAVAATTVVVQATWLAIATKEDR